VANPIANGLALQAKLGIFYGISLSNSHTVLAGSRAPLAVDYLSSNWRSRAFT